MLTTAAPPPNTEIRQHTDGLVDFMLGPTPEDAGFGLVRMDSVSQPGLVSDAVMRRPPQRRSGGCRSVVRRLDGDVRPGRAPQLRHGRDPRAHPHSVFPFDIAGLDAIEIDLGDMSSVKRARREFASQIADVAAAQPSLSPVLATLQLDVMRESDATRSAARGVVRCRRQQAEGDRAASRRAGDADRRVASRDL